ncbi:hypothetical protein [Lysinibacillus telephonicus]|uniref:Uncharacterized protein n=1 Tax=Lysinibacillus telephonicus TaxID=1714840 RepID=A0A3S0J3W1_9BACI|nr:hypothetical protein [Lysinibacillus telephonicus]RTQ93694.1 hypothetical protein EKG35_08020 [Lysinibacillus telephonicus]
MNSIQEKRKEISSVIESHRNCQVIISNEEKQIYNIVSTSGLSWKERSDKWGKIFVGTDRLRIDLDYPVSLFTEEELKKFTQLPLKKEISNKNSYSHINPTVGDTKHDVVRIILYEDKLLQYDFTSPSFRAMLQKIINANML